MIDERADEVRPRGPCLHGCGKVRILHLARIERFGDHLLRGHRDDGQEQRRANQELPHAGVSVCMRFQAFYRSKVVSLLDSRGRLERPVAAVLRARRDALEIGAAAAVVNPARPIRHERKTLSIGGSIIGSSKLADGRRSLLGVRVRRTTGGTIRAGMSR